LIIPVALHGDFIDAIQSECKAAAAASAASAAAATAAAAAAAAEEEEVVHEANDYEDLWGVPLLQYLTNHR
jgi:ribosomal protein L12E/L44/L45/RPP1/RPP2